MHTAVRPALALIVAALLSLAATFLGSPQIGMILMLIAMFLNFIGALLLFSKRVAAEG